MRRLSGIAGTVALVMAPLTSGCATGNVGTVRKAVAPDTVKVTGVSPDPADRLHPGQTVVFRVNVVSTLSSADLGHVSLVIQDNRGRNLKHGAPQSRMGVGRGTEMLELHDEGVISLDARWVTVFVALFPDGATKSSAVGTVRFAVVR